MKQYTFPKILSSWFAETLCIMDAFSIEELREAWQSALVIDCMVNTIPFISYVNSIDKEPVSKKPNKKNNKKSCLDTENWVPTTERIANLSRKRRPAQVPLGKKSKQNEEAPSTREDLKIALAAKIESLRQARNEKLEADKKASEERRNARAESDVPRKRNKKEMNDTHSKTKNVEIEIESDDDLDTGRLVSFEEKQQKAKHLQMTAGIPNAPGNKKKRLLDALKDIETTQKKIQNAKTPEERAQIEKELATERALARADGKKLKTDASRVKKSLKLIDSQKAAGNKTKIPKEDQRKKEHNQKRADARKDKQQKKQLKEKSATKPSKSFEELADEHRID